MNLLWLLLGLFLSAAVASLGYWRRALSRSGVAGAILVGTLIFGFGGWEWGLLLIAFFVSSSWLSHYRKTDKVLVAEKFSKGMRRDIGQTLANGGLGAILAVVYARNPEPLLFAAFVGVMATVTADTWATELGILSRVPPRLITSGDVVPPGTSGGVSTLGTWSSVAGALLIGTVATALVQVGSLLGGNSWSLRATSYTLLAVVGGLVGALFDSLLGATVQGIYYCAQCAKETESPVHHCGTPAQPLRGWTWLNNDLVNFLASVVGGLAAASLALILWR
ncbi:MAG: DUF92 domain-containing protein [Anaerolineae bacterium]|jgi:uncharacterized protein (TIGR00297 family)